MLSGVSTLSGVWYNQSWWNPAEELLVGGALQGLLGRVGEKMSRRVGGRGGHVSEKLGGRALFNCPSSWKKKPMFLLQAV